MFTAVTGTIAISVDPVYRPDESAPDERRWTWSYRVVIENRGGTAVQLLTRRWLITDGRGVTREVAGRGVVGQQPSIPPGGRFEYTSGCPLDTPTGFMVGSYRMITEDGDTLDVAIPAFPLDLPDAPRVLN
ncbi:Co2+/Mg2+ efflux protein ApaG [Oharaeibacter diazotrophicus]|uniref:Protein ApaG n=1 Tax=Oharaeibacter diazotrophicus TaxID=1920512 RepID=A0A4V3CVH2_9HYPH|nr:Co2+/Mg2+ efflux protein ApaG [Oharaeibacter diazotrophicus]TDP82468.1 ApaG protein [Oharaeibacter diazotrophicus]BBE72769.1 CO2+/Mg2+ efflux protein ApaG [Pleomorphomonas sp. SM30]